MGFALAELYVSIEERGFGPLAEQIKQVNAGMEKAADKTAGADAVLQRLNRQRRESIRLQRLAKAAGEGEAQTAALLAAVNLRLLGRSREVKDAFAAKNRQVVE